ncbi:MAG: hypothetical protein V5A38_09030 [Halolamina sp.]|uniref:hypothetical protein n=1 Tax=Halolamina sp. TaxID=1940283 RepID=UPI002FC33F69
MTIETDELVVREPPTHAAIDEAFTVDARALEVQLQQNNGKFDFHAVAKEEGVATVPVTNPWDLGHPD